MVCGIYLITRKDTSQKYVGQSNNIKRRLQQHIRGDDIGHSWIDNAISKHSVDKFIFQIITELPDDEKVLLDHEKYWIKFYNAYEDKNHYNLTPGGDFNPMRVPEIVEKMSGENHSFYGKHHTAESRKKISEAKKGVSYGRNLAVSESNRRRTGENHPLYGKSPSDETLKKQSESKIGEKNAKWGTSKLEKYGGLDYLYDAIERGKTQEDVSRELDMSVGAIISYLNARDESWITLRKKATRRQKYGIIDERGGLNFIIDCIKDKKTQEEIANELGLTTGNIFTYLKYEGTSWSKLKKETNRNKWQNIDSQGGLNFIINGINDGKNADEIAKELGIGHSTLWKYLKEKGYTFGELKKEIRGE